MIYQTSPLDAFMGAGIGFLIIFFIKLNSDGGVKRK